MHERLRARLETLARLAVVGAAVVTAAVGVAGWWMLTGRDPALAGLVVVANGFLALTGGVLVAWVAFMAANLSERLRTGGHDA